jgi:hypothetical protein
LNESAIAGSHVLNGVSVPDTQDAGMLPADTTLLDHDLVLDTAADIHLVAIEGIDATRLGTIHANEHGLRGNHRAL